MPREDVKQVLKQIIDNPDLLNTLAKLTEHERQALMSQDPIFYSLLRRLKNHPDFKVYQFSDGAVIVPDFPALPSTPPPPPPPPPEPIVPPLRSGLHPALLLITNTNSSRANAQLQAIAESSEGDRFEKVLDILSESFK